MQTDEGGRRIIGALEQHGHAIVSYEIVPDEPSRILSAIAATDAQVVLLTGGTGISKRDSTFEAVSSLLVRPLPGFGELFRMLSFEQIGSAAMLSRAVAGITPEGLLVFAMPGSPAAVKLAMDKLILPELGHLLEELQR